MDLLSAIVTLFLIMDPLGNVPLFLSALKPVAPERRPRVIVRELAFAYVILMVCLFLGDATLRLLGLQQETISVAGGIVLFLIALRMIFPAERHGDREVLDEEPFLVPLAVPLVAGPSTLAALLLLQRSSPGETLWLVVALTSAWLLSGVILLASPFFYRALGDRGLIAMERLMGMLLVMIAVQMFLNGVRTFLAH